MINKSNDLPSFVNETNLPNIVDKLTDAKNIKISNNKYGNRVQTVVDKIVEKADDITKAIKQEVVNNSYSFKVGTGNVDVSTDVQDGFGEIGVKGVTYQNILNNFSMDNKASEYITVNENTIKWTKSAVTTFNVNIKYHNSLAQLGKTYTLVFYIYKNTLQREGAGDSYNVAKFNIISYDGGFCLIPVNKTGLVKVKLIQPTTTPTDSKPYLEVFKESVGELEISYPILLEGDYTNDDKIPNQFEGIVGVGDKSKNLFNYKLHDSIEYNGSYYTVVKERWKSNTVEYTVEPNTDYTISVDRCEGNLWLAFEVDGVQFNNNNYSKFSKVIRTNETGKLLLRVGANTSADVGHKFINLQLKKGTVATTYEPYHDGHKIEILSCNKNLLNWKEEEFIPVGGSGYGIASKDHLGVCFDCNGLTDKGYGVKTNRQFTLKPNTKYTLGCEWDILRGTTSLTKPFSRVHFPNTNTYIGWKENGYVTFTTDCTGAVFLMFYIDTPSKSDIKVRFKNMFLYEGETNSYIENNQDKTQILLDEPLMRLPNGVHDEITRDGKLIRRVGKIIFNGSENWKTAINNNKSRFDLSLNSVKTPSTWNDKTVPNMICSNLIVQPFNQIYSNGKSGITYYHANSDRLIVASLGNSCSLVEFKQWLSQNPTTVYYELETPVITELPAPCLRMFKDGHLTFNTLVAPESNHVVQLNKSAQIQNAIKESQFLDNRINVLENNYDNLMLSTISRLNDLELNYTLK